MSDQPPSTTYLTDTQRRRAQALALVAHLFPHASHGDAHRIARWICTGKTTT